MRRLKQLVLVGIIILCGPLVLAQTQYYGTYSHAPQGSARAMALGGAYAGLSDDASGLAYNPAGLGHGVWNFDFGSTANTTLNREADINRDHTNDGVIFHFDFLALALRMGRVAFAVGQSSPYSTEIYSKNSLNQRAGIRILNTDISMAVLVTPNLSLGITQHSSQLTENYLAFGEQLFEDHQVGKYTTYGLSYRPEKKIGFGFSYTPRTQIDVPATANDITLNGFPMTLSWFKGVVLPARYTFGGFFKGSEDLMYIADLDFIHPDSNSVLVESPFDGSGQTNNQVKPQLVQIPHGGIEYTVFSQAKKAFIWRVGSYKEPARVVGAKDRFHFTMGVELRLGALVVSASMDETTGFSNSSQSISFVFGGS